MTLDEVIDKYIGREKYDQWIAREEERVTKINEEHLDKSVVEEFMQGVFDGTCPKCGNHADAIESDEGNCPDHWFERYWKCTDCGAEFTERYEMTPRAIWLTEV